MLTPLQPSPLPTDNSHKGGLRPRMLNTITPKEPQSSSQLNTEVSRGGLQFPPKVMLANENRYMKWLSLGQISGLVGSVTLLSAYTALGITYLSSSSLPELAMIVGIAFIATCCRDIVRFRRITGGKNQGVLLQERIQREIAPLLEQRKSKIHKIIRAHHYDSLSVLSTPWGRNYLLCDPRIAEVLNDKELKGILSHEVNHLNRSFTRVMMIVPFLLQISSMTLLYSSAHYVYYMHTLPAETLSRPALFLFSAVIGTTLALIGDCITGSLLNIALRANEHKTDMRAVKMTADHKSYCALLAKLTDNSDREEKGRIFPWLRRVLSSHPPMRERYMLLMHFFRK